MSNSFNISVAPQVAAVQTDVTAIGVLATNMNDVDLPAVNAIVTANGAIIANINDVDLPEVKIDTGNIRGTDVPALTDEIKTNLPVMMYEITADILHSNDDEVSTQLTAYTKLKEIISPVADDLSIHFATKNSGLGIAYGRIYINDVAQGTERTNSFAETWDEWTETITVAEGDLIQLYIYISQAENTAYAKDFRILGKITREFFNKM